MLHFVTSYMKQNKSRKQTLESAQYGLEISFNNQKTDTQNKISIEETVITWFTFKPGLELTGFRTTQLCFQQFYLAWARDPIENQHLVSGQLQ